MSARRSSAPAAATRSSRLRCAAGTAETPRVECSATRMSRDMRTATRSSRGCSRGNGMLGESASLRGAGTRPDSAVAMEGSNPLGSRAPRLRSRTAVRPVPRRGPRVHLRPELAAAGDRRRTRTDGEGDAGSMTTPDARDAMAALYEEIERLRKHSTEGGTWSTVYRHVSTADKPIVGSFGSFPHHHASCVVSRCQKMRVWHGPPEPIEEQRT